MGRNASECRAGLESEDAAPSFPRSGEGRGGSVETTDPAAGVMAVARAKGSLSNVRGPTGRSMRGADVVSDGGLVGRRTGS